ncbi:lipoprotein [Streptomyces purpurascens]|nr:lipoprotein [Streptomyces purpurascens]
MNRPARLVTAALTASAALLLTACGSGGGDESSSDKIAGADSAEKSSASPSVSASADGIDRPAIKLPSDMTLDFEGQQTGDATKDAILADNERAVSTVWQAVASGDLKKSGMGFYYTDTALRAVYDYAKNNNANKTSWAGTLRYFDRQVTVFDKTTAALTYCVDESNANVKDLKTNKVNVVETSPDSYVYYNTGVKKDKEGVWHIWQLHEDRGSKRCQP